MITNGRRAAAVPCVLVASVLAACGSAEQPVALTGTQVTASGSGLTTRPVSALPSAIEAPPAATTITTAPPTTAPRPTTRVTPAPTTTPTTTAPRTTAPKATGSSAEAQVVALTNKARATAGCDALTVDRRLTKAAQGHSDDMAEESYFAHDSQDGTSFDQRIEKAGYPSPGGENIARGQRSAAEVVRAWLDSPGHRANIENCGFRTIGVGHAPGDYWTQDFGR